VLTNHLLSLAIKVRLEPGQRHSFHSELGLQVLEQILWSCPGSILAVTVALIHSVLCWLSCYCLCVSQLTSIF